MPVCDSQAERATRLSGLINGLTWPGAARRSPGGVRRRRGALLRGPESPRVVRRRAARRSASQPSGGLCRRFAADQSRQRPDWARPGSALRLAPRRFASRAGFRAGRRPYETLQTAKESGRAWGSPAVAQARLSGLRSSRATPLFHNPCVHRAPTTASRRSNGAAVVAIRWSRRIFFACKMLVFFACTMLEDILPG